MIQKVCGIEIRARLGTAAHFYHRQLVTHQGRRQLQTHTLSIYHALSLASCLSLYMYHSLSRFMPLTLVCFSLKSSLSVQAFLRGIHDGLNTTIVDWSLIKNVGNCRLSLSLCRLTQRQTHTLCESAQRLQTQTLCIYQLQTHTLCIYHTFSLASCLSLYIYHSLSLTLPVSLSSPRSLNRRSCVGSTTASTRQSSTGHSSRTRATADSGCFPAPHLHTYHYGWYALEGP